MNYFLLGAPLRGAKNSVYTATVEINLPLVPREAASRCPPRASRGSAWFCVSAQGTPSSESHAHPSSQWGQYSISLEYTGDED